MSFHIMLENDMHQFDSLLFLAELSFVTATQIKKTNDEKPAIAGFCFLRGGYAYIGVSAVNNSLLTVSGKQLAPIIPLLDKWHFSYLHWQFFTSNFGEDLCV